MKKLKSLLAIAVTALLLTSCGESDSYELVKKLNTSYEYDGKTIEIKGHLSPPSFVWGSLTDRKELSVGLSVPKNINSLSTERTYSFNLKYGEGKNTVKINAAPGADKYSDTDLVFYDANGEELSTTDEVVLTAKVTYTAKGPTKASPGIKVPSFKGADEKNADNNDYTYTLTEVSFKKD